ncbi:type I restriction endonuclease subunit R [Comamonadaceae bacterium M7527]|nr:type I restriction endonuclease subunit R [Comamonadaceae bacterium M7527]
MAFMSEAALEQMLIDQLNALGYSIATEDVIGPDGSQPERDSHDQVILTRRLASAVARINPSVPAEARVDAVRRLTQTEFPTLLEENRRIHKLLTEGVDVEYHEQDATIKAGKVNLIDFENVDNNDWLAVNQFVVIAGTHRRRPDVVVFVNGMPLAVIELKAPGNNNATVVSAFNQLQTYKSQIPALFTTNAVLITSDGLTARIGSLSAAIERFMPWRTTNGQHVATQGTPEQQTLIEGVLERGRLLQLLRDFTVFGNAGAGLLKIIAGYHQFHAVRRAVASTIRAASQCHEVREDPADYGLASVKIQAQGDKRVGVIWHTQGSGKSLLMAFYAGQLVKHPLMANPTLVVLTDRNDLDDQLFGTFSMCQDLIRQRPEQANSREDLQQILSRSSGGVVFTTIQKFSPDAGSSTYPVLTNRRNVVVIVDEAHRSQYGFKAKIDSKTGEIGYGFAKYLRDALPNASLIGFTGTPIEADDVNTPAVFGNYIDVYDISRAVEDGATVPIYYESRLARIELDEDEKPNIDAAIEALTEEDDPIEQDRFKKKWSTIKALVGSHKRIELVAKDLVDHFEARTSAMPGKAMVVCMSRSICIKLHDAIVKLRPQWYRKDDTQGVVKVVMTGAASDPVEWQEHIGNKQRRDALAVRARDPEDDLQIVIVRDMWLTGFDAPCMHTMYIDKPMRGHGLMQAIARVNRVFKDKQGGLIVDYIGIAQNLKSALQMYSSGDRDKTGIDERQAVAVMLEKYEVVCDMFHGHDYRTALGGTPQARMLAMAGAIDWVLGMQQKLAEQEKTEAKKKQAHRRYQDAVLALSKAFSLASASDEARCIREEVGFFQAIRAALVKSAIGSTTTQHDKDMAIQQIVSRAVISTEIVDILAATGLKSPDISILSEDFLAELQQMKRQNLALEALKKLLNDGIRSRSKANVVETKGFTERLERAVARYHANAITTAEVLQELIELAKDIRAARARGEDSGLSDDEIAFYDALAENSSAVEIMGNDQLKLIAHELLESLKANVSVDWAHRENARARLRVLVKRILRKYGYPPDLQDTAVQMVLQQAEALSAMWSGTERL